MTKKMNYKIFNLNNFTQIPKIKEIFSQKQINDIEVVGNVLPFKANNYVVDELIDWDNIPNDPIFQLTFPQKGMLSAKHFSEMQNALHKKVSRSELKQIANKIRYKLNPNPAGQENNVPVLNNTKLTGIQHKYRETVLFFPSHSQTCHAYCTFCFRWPQFIGISDLKFGMKETELLVLYLKQHPEVTDVLFTGGDPMIMPAKKLSEYIEPLLSEDIPNLQTIRIGTKSLAYWPYKYISDNDSDDVLNLFEKIVKSGKQLAFMAHFNHPNELKTKAVQLAIKRILNTGATIRTQSPIMNHINNDYESWVDMWNTQVNLGCIPYYMFVARDTGAQDYFAVTLEEALDVFRKAYKRVSGVARTVRGPSMSANPGKIHILDINEINNKKAMTLRFIQGRKTDWIGKVFFAKYNPEAIWISDLEPLENEELFFFEKQMN